MADQANNRDAATADTAQTQQTAQTAQATQQVAQATQQTATTVVQQTGAAAATAGTTQQAAAKTSPWGEDWRTHAATFSDGKPDEAALKLLGRHTDPTSLVKKIMEQDKLISSGALKQVSAFPEKGTDEEKAKWRTDNGVPALPADYLKAVKLPKDAEPVAAQVEKYLLPELHNANASPAAAQAAVNALAKFRSDSELALKEADTVHMNETQDALRAVWVGPDYRQNIGAVERFVGMFPEKLQPLLKDARLPDGRALFNSPEALQTMARLSRELNPIKTTLPNGANGPKAIDARIAEIKSVMQSDRQRYNGDQAMQNEYRDLLRAQEHMKTRAA